MPSKLGQNRRLYQKVFYDHQMYTWAGSVSYTVVGGSPEIVAPSSVICRVCKLFFIRHLWFSDFFQKNATRCFLDDHLHLDLNLPDLDLDHPEVLRGLGLPLLQQWLHWGQTVLWLGQGGSDRRTRASTLHKDFFCSANYNSSYNRCEMSFGGPNNNYI